LHDYVAHKQVVDILPLICRAILCNWLVCLAIWGAARIANEAAKIWFIGWCLLAFVACGFEHSVANMTVFIVGLLDPHQAGTLYGMFYNLLWVTIGNIIGGAVLVAGAYLAAAKIDSPSAVLPTGKA
ncbi:MAG: formate/nitrite transporter family protein, partial [Caulobacteraceae bacterium]